LCHPQTTFNQLIIYTHSNIIVLQFSAFCCLPDNNFIEINENTSQSSETEVFSPAKLLCVILCVILLADLIFICSTDWLRADRSADFYQ